MQQSIEQSFVTKLKEGTAGRILLSRLLCDNSFYCRHLGLPICKVINFTLIVMFRNFLKCFGNFIPVVKTDELSDVGKKSKKMLLGG
jgi:hypothetical protein